MNSNILLIFAIQIVSEFLPISSSLLLTTLAMEEGILFHIFSGIIVTILYFSHIWEVIRSPLKNKHIIQVYFWAVLPSVIVGLLITAYPVLVVKSLKFSLICNIIAGIILFLMIFIRKENREIFTEQPEIKEAYSFTIRDAMYLGVITSLSGFIPGLSRLGSGLTYTIMKKKNILYANQTLFITGIPSFFGKPILHMIQHPGARHLFVDFVLNQHIYALLIGLVVIVFFDKVKSFYSSNVLLSITGLRIIYYSYYLFFSMS